MLLDRTIEAGRTMPAPELLRKPAPDNICMAACPSRTRSVRPARLSHSQRKNFFLTARSALQNSLHSGGDAAFAARCSMTGADSRPDPSLKLSCQEFTLEGRCATPVPNSPAGCCGISHLPPVLPEWNCPLA